MRENISKLVGVKNWGKLEVCRKELAHTLISYLRMPIINNEMALLGSSDKFPTMLLSCL